MPTADEPARKSAFAHRPQIRSRAAVPAPGAQIHEASLRPWSNHAATDGGPRASADVQPLPSVFRHANTCRIGHTPCAHHPVHTHPPLTPTAGEPVDGEHPQK